MNEVLQSARGVWRQRNPARRSTQAAPALQSARDVWRQRSRPSSTHSSPRRCNLHGACGGKDEVLVLCCLRRGCNLHGACGGKERGSQGRGRRRELQSARGVWRQSVRLRPIGSTARLQSARGVWRQSLGCLAYRIGSICCNLHGACGGKVKRSQERGGKLHVAICTGRAEKPNGIILRKNPRKFMQTYCIFIHLGV